jgi:hypothetical protein
MKRLLLSVCFVLVFAGLASAQSQAGTSSSLQWDIAAADLATANALTFRHYDDAAMTGVVFTGVSCVGATSPFVCTVPFPAFTPGSHTVAVSAANAAGESPRTAPLAFTFLVIPATPTTLRIAGGL